MNPLNEELVRTVLLGLVEISRNGSYSVSSRTRELFAEISPIEIEAIVNHCHRHVNVDVQSIEKDLLRIRRESLVRELILAGASNALVRDVFGLTPRELSLLRTETGVRSPSRRRLRAADIRLLESRLEDLPPGDSILSRSVWSLEASRDLDLPLMSIYRHINTTQDPTP